MINEVRIKIPRNRPVMAGNSNLIDENLIDFIFTFLKKHSVKRKKYIYIPLLPFDMRPDSLGESGMQT